ncbi:Hybrid signal transduction histidine kinase K-like protein [Cladobotryum mycophilum]|uniref:Hybrid signal transduction histidine kinase K-like protein n=1 Tax=Cladobotryum mycophilum TaxID=491253 RepID=A0ABR0SKX1_9HYPO
MVDGYLVIPSISTLPIHSRPSVHLDPACALRNISKNPTVRGWFSTDGARQYPESQFSTQTLTRVSGAFMPLERDDSFVAHSGSGSGSASASASNTATTSPPTSVSAPATDSSDGTLGFAPATPLVTATSGGSISSSSPRQRRGHSSRLSTDLHGQWLPDSSHEGQVGPSSLADVNTNSLADLSPQSLKQAVAAARIPRFDSIGKRSSIQAKDHTMESVPKKARTGASPPRKIDMRTDPAIPMTLPLDDAATAMLARTREEVGSVTTVKLPRANASSASPAVSGSTPGSLQSSMDLSAAPSLSTDVRSMQPGLQILHGVGVLELLENDDRPTFLVDLANSQNANRSGLPIIYYNASLRATQGLQQLLSPRTTIPRSPPPPPPPSHEYGTITWVSTTLRRRFRFVSGNVAYHSARTVSPLQSTDETITAEYHASDRGSPSQAIPSAEMVDPSDYFGDAAPKQSDADSVIAMDPDYDTDRRHPDDFTNQVLQSQPVKSIFDWTRIPMDDSLPDHIKRLKTVDWASTPVGPISEWNSHLRTMTNLVMGTPHPAAMYWGPEYVCFYNTAYIELAGKKHPGLLGLRYVEGWPEIWEHVEPTFKLAWESGQATMKHDNQLFINRNGYLEETFFSWSVIPLLGEDGEVAGIYNPCFENTRRRINERRMLTLREIGERTASASSVSQFWPEVQKGLEYNEFDVPFSLIYSVKDEMESEASSLHSGSLLHSHQLMLEGSPGVPEGHTAAPSTLDLRASEDGFAPYMRQSLSMGGAPVILSQEDGNLPTHLLDGFQWRGFGDPCRMIVIFPVIPTTTAEAVTGFIVLGLNPRRPYDDDYRLFIHLLSRQLATSMASVVLFEEEIRRGQRAAQLAALDRQELSKQLWQRTQEANELEYKFTRMAEFAPVGMFIANGQGHINYCNDMWWQISRHSRSEEIGDAWMDSVRAEDRSTLEATWRRLLEEKVTISVEFRFNCSQEYGDNTIDTWVLMSAFPEKHPDGSLMSIFGCITDISSQKWAEKVQSERREEAVELKRQQENFIDITSHEMRNPLSAILQCVDQIANSISTFAAHADRNEVDNLLDSCLDAANTINLCASHQKRIVDDILTLSKLDSKLLAVTPVDEQPTRVVYHTLKMFESELLAHDIELEFLVDKSFETYGAQWAKLDSSRLRQVLINLMTNAIKFTQGREKRMITVSMCATKDISEITSRGVHYFDRNDNQRTVSMDINNQEEWGDGERINIHCSVEDTGSGLGEQELKLLFQRFQQATPRTHVQYGGSGLGLFISRILTEMQGGQIGVSSQKDLGSKFSFYIQSRKCQNPPAEYEHITPFKIERKMQSPATTTSLQLMSNPPSRTHSDAGSNTLFDVLIVEDNIVNQKVLQRQLRNCGNNTFVANHGREALQTIQRSRFWLGQETQGVDISVILMDLEMPVMDGMTCARKIRELERQGTIISHIPIIAVTAYARPEQIENAKAAGIDDVISKPFRIPELIPKIEELVGKYRNLSVSAGA